MKRDPENDKVVLGMDILAPEGYGEIVGGSERESDLNILLERIEEEKLDKSDYEWFLDLRKLLQTILKKALIIIVLLAIG